MFRTQPLTQPLTCMLIQYMIGFADWPKAEVIGPTVHHLVEFGHHYLMVQLSSIMSSLFADRLTDADHSLLGWNCTQIGASRLRRVATTKRVTQKIELLFR